MKRFVAILAVGLMLFAGVPFLNAKGGGGGRSGGGGYSKPSSSSSHSTYSKPTINTWDKRGGGGTISTTPKPSSGYTKPTTTKPSSGYTKPGSPAPGSAAKPLTLKSNVSSFDKKATIDAQKAKSGASLQAYKTEQAKFKQPPTKFDSGTYKSSGLYNSTPVYGRYDAGRHITVQKNYYSGMGYTPAPYVYGFSPSYGLFNTMFMFWMLDNMNHNRDAAMMAHSYQNNPDYIKWKQDAAKKAETDPALKAKIDEMDKKLDSMKGQPIDPNFKPKSIPAEVIISPEAMMAKAPATPTLRMMTGPVGLQYEQFGKQLKQSATSGGKPTLDIILTGSAGSIENLRALLEDRADIALVQSDVLAMLQVKFPDKKLVSEQVVAYPEFMQIIVNSKSKTSSIKDLIDGKTTLYIGQQGSGTSMSWEMICEQNPDYKKVTIKYGTPSESLQAVTQNPKAALFLVTSLHSKILEAADEIAKKTKSLRLVPVDDSKLDSKKDTFGNPVYTFYTIPRNVYPGLQHGFLWNHSVKTLTVNAVLVLNTSWAQKFGPESMDFLTYAVLETKSEIGKKINGGL